MGTDELNFGSKQSALNLGKIDISPSNIKVKSFKETAGQSLDAFEKMAVRIAFLSIIVIICYSVITKNLMANMTEKQEDTASSMTAEYDAMRSRLNNRLVVDGETIFAEKEITDFLQTVGSTIPKEVKLVTLENTQGRHFVIEARAIKYQQLGYFKSLLRINNVLTNIQASTGIKYHDSDTDEDYVLITIEGDLPEQL